MSEHTFDSACAFIVIAVFLFFTYLRVNECEAFKDFNDGNPRKYKSKELMCALGKIKEYIEKDGTIIQIIDVKSVKFIMNDCEIIVTIYNLNKRTTKLYKAVLKNFKIVEMIENVLRFDEQDLEVKKFGRVIGLHDSESLSKQYGVTHAEVSHLARYSVITDELNQQQNYSHQVFASSNVKRFPISTAMKNM